MQKTTTLIKLKIESTPTNLINSQ